MAAACLRSYMLLTWLWHVTRYIAREKRKTTSENQIEAATWQDKWSPDQVTQRESRSSSQFLRSQPACMQLSIHAPGDRHGGISLVFALNPRRGFPYIVTTCHNNDLLVLFCDFTTPTLVDRTVDRRPALTTIVVPTFRQSLWTQHLRCSNMNGTSFMWESREVWRKSLLDGREQRRSAFQGFLSVSIFYIGFSWKSCACAVKSDFCYRDVYLNACVVGHVSVKVGLTFNQNRNQSAFVFISFLYFHVLQLNNRCATFTMEC